ncbi:DMT family transporter [Roseibium sp. CAU 1637]|uniref:DMT family transporter n=1 Tax=Roseibium limicola TaxID=2816037 RepID=A0A939ENI1_9HYPH|nr:DMT family transporter [Roseibium limicola]MBO0345076.1 DMT family transporter [Roseibium limicola]
MTQSQTRGALEMSAAMLISGSIGYFVLLSGQSPFQVVFWRCAFGLLALFPVCFALGLLRPGSITLRQALWAAFGGVAIVINWLLLFSAYDKAGIGVATVVYNTQPFMLVALGALVLKERPTAQKLAWLTLAFAGVLMIIGEKPQGDYLTGNYASGVLLALGAAALYAGAALIAKKLKGVPPHLIALIQVGVGIVLLSPVLLAAPLPQTSGSWASLGALGLFHTGLMYVLLYGAIQKLPTTLTAALSYIYPVAALLIDTLFLGTSLHPLQIGGTATILLAAAGATFGWHLPLLRRAGVKPQSL